MFQRFFEDGLAQSSYLIACERARQAVVVDPRRDVAAYVETARERGLSIVHAIETHIHADFVSGVRELAAGGARPIAGPGASLGFPFHEAAHRERIMVGDIAITVLHTPGHTPEHVCLLIEEPGAPVRILTGDTLFVGAVGRPDLAGEEMTRELAARLFDSLHGTLLALADDVEVHPGHGAGSLCGAGIGSAPSSTIGQERRWNPFLQHRTAPEFVAAVLADLPDTAPYFARVKELNRVGPALLGSSMQSPPDAIDVRAVAAAVAAGAFILDLRRADAFAGAHPAGAIHLEFGSTVGYWAGWVIPEGARLILLAENPEQAADARWQLSRVGFDTVAGWLTGGLDAWRLAGLPVSRIERTDMRGLAARVRSHEALTVVDVRSSREFATGHVEGAVHIPLDAIAPRAGELGHGAMVATVCETGYRASLAASLLAREGTPRVMSTAGGMAEYKMKDAR